MSDGKKLTHLHLTLIQLVDRGPATDAYTLGKKAEEGTLLDYLLDSADASDIDTSILRHFLTQADRDELEDWLLRTTNAYDADTFGLPSEANGWLYLIATLNGPFRRALEETNVEL